MPARPQLPRVAVGPSLGRAERYPEAPLEGGPGSWRRTVPALALVAYVGGLGVWADRGADPGGWLTALLALGVALVAVRRRTASGRALGTGLAVVLASVGAQAPSVGLEGCGAVGAMACAVTASLALARMAWDGGIVRPTTTRARPWVIAAAIPWGGEVVARVGGASGVWPPQAASGWGLFAAATAVLALAGQVEWTLHRRRLELGVAARALALRALLASAATAAVLAAILGHAHGAGGERLTVAVAGGLVGSVALARDPVRVARLSRRVVALGLVGGSVALLGASAAQGRGWDAWASTFVACIATLALGTVASYIEAPLLPGRGAWLEAFAQAGVDASHGDPDEAVRAVLLALRAPGGAQSASPELWTLEPTRVTTVDAAGYAREREGEMPEALLLVAAAEPEATLRTDVLDALEVRRPELRPLARWMNDRAALMATVVTCEGETDGLLVIPRCDRTEPVTLEEVRAFKVAADRLAAACRARAAQTRLLSRAHEATLRAEAGELRVARLEHGLALDVGRDVRATTRLARPATVGAYSAAARMALDALERRTETNAPLAIVAPSGLDPTPYLARAHLAGARREAPFVVVDATSSRDHEPMRWRDPASSPLALANGGLLVLLDGAALPLEIQQLVARALAERKAPWEPDAPLDVQIALTGVAPPEELVMLKRLDPGLADRLGDARAAPIELPRLSSRPEDLRAILTDRLASEGLRQLGRPVGIDHAAYARLVDYAFPGEDAELASIAQQLVARCTGDVVRAADVEGLGLGAPRAVTSA